MTDSLFQQLKRRNVFKVTTGYLVLGWLVLQIADVILPALGLPKWILTTLIVVGAFGLPFVIFFSWAFELTPEGLRRDTSTSGDTAFNSQVSRTLDYVIIGLLILAIGFFIYDRNTRPIINSPEKVTATDLTNVPENSPPTIAVLPLINMSADADNAFFAGGVQEDILTNLSRIDTLKVISRTSVMQFIENQMDIKSIGESLGARYIVEGSVRKINNYVRVTVQLIDASDDTHIWANNYDRELVDIFATQSAIAEEISNSIHLAIQPSTVGTLRDMPTHSVEAYDHYLKALSIERGEPISETSLQTTREQLELAVKIDPDFVEAWGMLNEVLDEIIRTVGDNDWFFEQGPDRDLKVDELRQQAILALKKAMALSPDNEQTLIARSSGITGEEHLINNNINTFNERKEVMDYTLERYPDSSAAWYVISWWYHFSGDQDNATRSFNKALELDPFNARIVYGALGYFRQIGDQAKIDKLYARLTEISPELNKKRYLAKTSPLLVHFSLIMSYAKTADPTVIEPIRNFLGSEDFKSLPDLIRIDTKYRYKHVLGQDATLEELDRDLSILENHDLDNSDVDYEDLGFFSYDELNSYVRTYRNLALFYEQLGESDRVAKIASRLVQLKPEIQKHPDEEYIQTALAGALVDLERRDEARLIIETVISRRSAVFDTYGINGYYGESLFDVQSAVKRLLAEKAQEPMWLAPDIMVIWHRVFYDLIVTPEMQAYYVKEGKWLDYLAQHIPEYKQYVK